MDVWFVNVRMIFKNAINCSRLFIPVVTASLVPRCLATGTCQVLFILLFTHRRCVWLNLDCVSLGFWCLSLLGPWFRSLLDLSDLLGGSLYRGFLCRGGFRTGNFDSFLVFIDLALALPDVFQRLVRVALVVLTLSAYFVQLVKHFANHLVCLFHGYSRVL